MHLFYGILFGTIGQVLSFLQLQAGIKYGWWEKYPYLILASAVPACWMYIKSVQHLILSFHGELWPSRLIGFGIGVVVFSILSYILFKEAFTAKTIICLFLGFSIIAIQLFWR